MRLYQPPSPQEQALEKYVSHTAALMEQDAVLHAYFNDRGISSESVNGLRLGFCDPAQMYPPTEVDKEIGLAVERAGSLHWALENRITIPYIQDGVVLKVRGRVAPGVDDNLKYKDVSGAKAQPFYPAPVDPEHPVLVVEGEFDAVILRQNGIQAIGIPGAQSAKPEWLRGLHDVYLTFDADDAGRSGADGLLKKLPEVRRIDLPEGYDVSEYINTFGIDSFRVLIDKAVLYLHGKPQMDDKFSTIVEGFNDWAWTNGALIGPKMSWAPRLESALSGWSPGLVLFGAEAHSGKSCFLVKSLYSLCLENQDAIGVYLSLDDTLNETMLRLLSLHTGIDFNLLKTPRWSFDHPTDPARKRPEMLQQYNDGIASLKQVNNLILRDATYGRSLKYLRSFLESLRSKYPDKKIVVFVDSLAKITSDGAESERDGEVAQASNWKAYVASELKYLTTKHKICLVTPTDLRKMNGIRRPTRDDLKDAAELAYEAQVILLGYCDLKRNPDNPLLYWDDNGINKPVLEIIIDKNKFTGKTTVIRYKMDGGISEFWENDSIEDDSLNLAVASQKSQQRTGTSGYGGG